MNIRPSAAPALSDSGQQTGGCQTEASVSGGNALPAGNAPARSVLQRGLYTRKLGKL